METDHSMSAILRSAVALLLLLPVIPAAQEGVPMTVTGRIVLEEGQPAPGIRVQLYYMPSELSEDPAGDSPVIIASDATDAEGNFTLNFYYNPSWRLAELRLVKEDFDTFRYDEPENRNITDNLRQQYQRGAQDFSASWQLLIREGWEEEQKALERYGSDSDKGRLIRLRGMPDEVRPFRKPDGTSGEIWIYYSDGILVRFIGETRDRDFHFKPREK